MTTPILCKLRDSNNAPLTGYVRVLADYVIGDDIEGTLVMPAAVQVNLVNGQCTLNVNPSAVARVSYLFQVWQVTATETALLWELRAIVPDSLTAINLKDLQATGITRDALDSSILTVTNRLLTNDGFWNRLKTETLNFKGNYLSTAFYRRGDAVAYDGSSYVSIYDGVSNDKRPDLSPTFWLLIASKGTVATNLQGDDAVYDATTWIGDQKSPTKNTLRNIIQTKANIISPVFSLPSVSTTLAANDYSSNLAYTKWVADNLNGVRASVQADITNSANQQTAYTNAVDTTNRTWTTGQIGTASTAANAFTNTRITDATNYTDQKITQVTGLANTLDTNNRAAWLAADNAVRTAFATADTSIRNDYATADLQYYNTLFNRIETRVTDVTNHANNIRGILGVGRFRGFTQLTGNSMNVSVGWFQVLRLGVVAKASGIRALLVTANICHYKQTQDAFNVFYRLNGGTGIGLSTETANTLYQGSVANTTLTWVFQDIAAGSYNIDLEMNPSVAHTMFTHSCYIHAIAMYD